ncbi:MAG: SecD/SecF fusion protein [Solirubrobacteraceae bacterium]|jgi:SecD/SecF fusion protein|nr:SecD/SecF fusion protein [Solirubrobacteraceae bacterium]
MFYVVAVIAVVATVAGVLVLRGRHSGSDGPSFGGKDDPVLDAKMRRLQFYDWETNVIGPDGRPAPGDPKVTGGAKAGKAGALSLYDAVLRATKRPAIVDADNARPASIFFALDRARRRVIGNAAVTRAAARAAAPAGATIYEVRPGTAIVGAEGTADRWYVLDDNVAINGTETRNARQGIDQKTRRPVTLFAFTDTGLRLFRELTRKIAARGSQASLDRASDDPALHDQHFAVIYEGQIVTIPAVDFRLAPDGLDASGGTQLSEQLP